MVSYMLQSRIPSNVERCSGGYKCPDCGLHVSCNVEFIRPHQCIDN